jgi:hypothetical protein
MTSNRVQRRNLQISDQDLDSFVDGLIEANRAIEREQPDIVLAPMLGAVPLVDALNVVNPQFDNSVVFYVPASSTIKNLNAILPGTVKNLLSDVADPDHFMGEGLKILSIDEVVSGSSIMRLRSKVGEGIKLFVQQMKREGFDISEGTIQYMQIAFEHGIHIETGKEWNGGYKGLRESENKSIIPITVDRIITMDDPALCPISYIPKRDPAKNTPLVNPDFKVSAEYISLLSRIAAKVGTNPDDVGPRNLGRVMEHQEYIPIRYRNIPEASS